MSFQPAENVIVTTLSEEEMQEVYNWVDEIPLSRPKKNIARDFSDCGKYNLFINNYLSNTKNLKD